MEKWPHAPPHRLFEPGIFMVTAATYRKELHFRDPSRLDFLQDMLLASLREQQWRLQAWAVMANHYHVVAISPDNAKTLRSVLAKVHTLSARHVNELDGVPGRQVWFQYRETALTFRKSYFARLRYVHQNPSHHGLVQNAVSYPWCSAAWFEQRADPAFQMMLATFKTDQLSISDEPGDEFRKWRWELQGYT